MVPPVKDFCLYTALGRQVSNRCKTTFSLNLGWLCQSLASNSLRTQSSSTAAYRNMPLACKELAPNETTSEAKCRTLCTYLKILRKSLVTRAQQAALDCIEEFPPPVLAKSLL